MLMIMKYIPGLHLRISDEAEERGLDLDQFFDEQIGDWSYLEEVEKLRNTTIMGRAEQESATSSSTVKVNATGTDTTSDVKKA